MDVPGAAAPWIVLGAVLGMLVLVAASLMVRRVRHRPRPGPARPATMPRDDLPGFLESPPGSVGEDSADVSGGWASLAAPLLPPADEPPRRESSSAALATAAGLALALLVGATAVAAVASRSEDRSSGAERGPAGHEGGEAEGLEPEGQVLEGRVPEALELELQFGGLVLEPRAVGVTATYPRVSVTADRGRAVAEIALPLYNCLTADAPVDPVAAGCTPVPTEHARLTTPELTVEADADDAVRVTGRFPTSWRPNGSPPVPTGRAYTLELTARPDTGAAPGTWVPATGTLRLGDDVTSTTGGAADRLKVGG